MSKRGDLEEVLIEYRDQAQRLLHSQYTSWDAAFGTFKAYLQKTPFVKNYFDGIGKLPGTDGRHVFVRNGDRILGFNPPSDEQQALGCFWKLLMENGGVSLAMDCMFAGNMVSPGHTPDHGHFFMLNNIALPLFSFVEKDLERQIRALVRSESKVQVGPVVSVTGSGNSIVIGSGNVVSMPQVYIEGGSALILEKLEELRVAIKRNHEEAESQRDIDFVALQATVKEVGDLVRAENFALAAEKWEKHESVWVKGLKYGSQAAAIIGFVLRLCGKLPVPPVP